MFIEHFHVLAQEQIGPVGMIFISDSLSYEFATICIGLQLYNIHKL